MKRKTANGIALLSMAALGLGVVKPQAAEIADKQSCNAEADRLINLHMSKNLPAAKTAQIDLILKDLQSYCRKEAFEAAKANIAEADKLLK